MAGCDAHGIVWLNFSVLDGNSLRLKKICPVKSNDVLGTVANELISAIAKRVMGIIGYEKDPTQTTNAHIKGTDLDPAMPISAVVSFDIRYVQIRTESETSKSDTSSCSASEPEENMSGKSVFDVLMAGARKYDALPPRIQPPNSARQKLYNSVLDVMCEFSVGFRPCQVCDIGKTITDTLTETLWYIDPYLERLASRSIKLPTCFAALAGFRDLKKQHKKIPPLKTNELHEIVNKIGNMLMLPWFMVHKFKPFRDVVSALYDALYKYLAFLEQQAERSNERHKATETVRSVKDHWALETLEPPDKTNDKYRDLYKDLNEQLAKVDFYEAVPLCKFLPEDASERRIFVEHLKDAFPFPCHKWTYYHGNYLGNVYFLWKLPDITAERESAEDIRVMNALREEIPIYATRAMRQEFIHTYAKKTAIKPSVLRNMYNMLTGCESSAENAAEKAVNDRVCEFLLESDDTELVFDLRASNGRVKNPDFDQFWDALDKYLHEQSVVHDRRQSDISYMPLAMSVEDLRNKILETLPEGSAAPSSSWIRLNFMPQNRFVNAALNYTGRFNVKYRVQQRILRAKHEDSNYCFNQFLLLKEMAVKYRDYATFQCLDDKAIVPVGEPSSPVSTGVRARHGCLVVGSSGPVSLDHDFHIAGIVPSVCFLVEIPENPKDSFYTGTVHVTVKDKIFEPSSPKRHAAETAAIMSEISEFPPIMFRLTDGGPDHNTTFKSVQVAALCEFVLFDLDLLVLVRTAPRQSYNNPAERMMALLNIGLQNVAYARSEMAEHLERQMKSLSSIKAVRKAADKNPALKDALCKSMDAPISSVKERFQRLKWKDQKVIVHNAASEEEMMEVTKNLNKIDGSVDFDSIHSIKDVAKYPKLMGFMDTHCEIRQYTFQIKKCAADSEEPCDYCSGHPPRQS